MLGVKCTVCYIHLIVYSVKFTINSKLILNRKLVEIANVCRCVGAGTCCQPVKDGAGGQRGKQRKIQKLKTPNLIFVAWMNVHSFS